MDIYDELGVKKYINAYDTMTMYGSTIMDDDVLKASEDAQKYLVDINELQDKLGKKIAEITHNEAAYVTTGASMGISLCMAACMSEGDMYKLSILPDTSNMKNEVIIMRSQRNPYDKAIELPGAKLIEIGNLARTFDYELEGVINEKTAAVYFIKASNYAKANLELEKVIEIAHKHNVPVIMDAAAQLPPKENLWKFTNMGVDAVCFSGGKGIKGPLGTGFILGKQWIIDAAKKVGFPNRGICRGGKVSREDMVMAYLALKKYVSMTNEEYDTQLRNRVNYFVDNLRNNPLFEAGVEEIGPVGQIYPRVKVKLVNTKYNTEEFVAAVKNGEPGILLGLPLQKPYDVFYINPMTLIDDQLEIVLTQINKIAEELNK